MPHREFQHPSQRAGQWVTPKAADRITAYLEDIRDRAAWVRRAAQSRAADAPYVLGRARWESARDVEPLLAVVAEVLKLPDRWKAAGVPGDAQSECAEELRRVITRELLREDGS